MFSGLAPAQDGVTIYGSVDSGLRYLSNVNTAGNSRLTLGSTGLYNANRLGFRGVEDLGDGLNAHFDLESGFNLGTGVLDNAASVLFNRSAFVGLANQFGSIDLGHQYSVSFKTIGLYDPFNYKYTSIIPLAAISAGNGATNLGGFRFNNDLQYTGTFGPVTARAEYSFGEVSGAVSTNASEAVGLSYANGPLAIGAAYTKKKVAGAGTPGVPAGVGALPAATSSSPTFDNRSWTVGAAYVTGPLRIAGGYNDERQQNSTVAAPDAADSRVKVAWLGGSYDFTPAFAINAAWYRTRLENPTTGTAATGVIAAGSGKKDLFIIGMTYALSKRTNFYADIDRQRYSGIATGVPVAGAVTTGTAPFGQAGQTGVSAGINHLF
jgi:predicted porin